MKVLFQIIDTIRFLRREGYRIYVLPSSGFFERYAKEFSEFLPAAEEKPHIKTLPLFYGDTEIIEMGIAGDEEKLAALSVPLEFMFGRLYEESRKQVQEIGEHDVYRKALQYIKERYTEGITVADVSGHIGYSESYFGYAFKKKYKMSINQYVRELQLAKSKDLLENTSFSVSSVASYVGFDDSNYFSALFKKYFGLSPKEYRKKHSTLV